MSKVRRKVHFYEIQLLSEKVLTISRETIVELCNLSIRLSAAKESRRFLATGHGLISIIEMHFIPEKHQIVGKLLKTRKDVFPDLHNISDDTLRGIEADDDEGVAEATHFVIDYSSSVVLALEYNHSGPKVRELSLFFEHLSSMHSAYFKCTYKPIVRDTMYGFINHINRMSWFEMRVSKDNVNRLQEVDDGLWTAAKTSLDFSRSEYVHMRFKYEYEKMPDTNYIKGLVARFINRFRGGIDPKNIFEVLTIGAEDTTKENHLQAFDLLSNKVMVEVDVDKHPKTRSIVSESIWEHLKTVILEHI